jgi:hypothetical protein
VGVELRRCRDRGEEVVMTRRDLAHALAVLAMFGLAGAGWLLVLG